MTPCTFIYDGQNQVGAISIGPGGFTAYDLAEKKIGVFKSRLEAVRAVLNASSAAKIDEALKVLDRWGCLRVKIARRANG